MDNRISYLDDRPELVDYAKNAVRVAEVNRKAVVPFHAAAPTDLIGPVELLFSASANA